MEKQILKINFQNDVIILNSRRDNLNLREIYLKNIQKKASINEAIFYFDKQKASLSAYRTFFFKKYG